MCLLSSTSFRACEAAQDACVLYESERTTAELKLTRAHLKKLEVALEGLRTLLPDNARIAQRGFTVCCYLLGESGKRNDSYFYGQCSTISSSGLEAPGARTSGKTSSCPITCTSTNHLFKQSIIKPNEA